SILRSCVLVVFLSGVLYTRRLSHLVKLRKDFRPTRFRRNEMRRVKPLTILSRGFELRAEFFQPINLLPSRLDVGACFVNQPLHPEALRPDRPVQNEKEQYVNYTDYAQ